MSMTPIRAESRTPDKPTGRALRRTGMILGVYYDSERVVKYVQFEQISLQRLLRSEFGLLELQLEGEAFPCVIREVQRHPVRGDIIHLDLMGVKSDVKVRVSVPVNVVGVAKGVKNEGGTLDVTVHQLEVECLPGNIPNNLEVDVSELGTNEGLRISDLSFEGIEIIGDPQNTIVHVLPPRVVEETAEEAEAAEEEAAEPEVIKEKKDEDSSE